MKTIKAKIIGDQVWTVENLSRSQYYLITGRTISIKNENWYNYNGPKCFAYKNNSRLYKKEYLFDIHSVEYLNQLNRTSNQWRIPTLNDLDIFFKHIDGKSNAEWPSEEIAVKLRGTYGWNNNGKNEIGFNAYPNPTLNENCELSETEISRWWIYNNKRNEFNGFGIYQEDIVAFSGIHNNSGLAIRLVRNLENPRPENNILYV